MENKKEVTKKIENLFKEFDVKFDLNVDNNNIQKFLNITSSPFFWNGQVNYNTDAKPLWKVQREFKVERARAGYGFKYADLQMIKEIAEKIDARVSISIVGDKDVEYIMDENPRIIKTLIFCVIFEGAPYYGRPLKIEKRFAVTIGKVKATGAYNIDYANGSLETYATRYMYNSFFSVAGIDDPEQNEVTQMRTATSQKVEKIQTLKSVDNSIFEKLKTSNMKNLFITTLKRELKAQNIKYDETKDIFEQKEVWENLNILQFNGIIKIIK